MKKAVWLLFFASFSLRAEIIAQITHFSGDVFVNGEQIQEKTTLLPRYKVEIKPTVSGSFAFISFKSGHQLLIKNGSFVVDELALDLAELSCDQCEILMMAQSLDKRHFLPVLKIHSRQASFSIYGGKLRLEEKLGQAGLDVVQGKVLMTSAWGKKEILSEQGAAVNSGRMPASDNLSLKRLKWLKRQFRTMGLR